MTKTVADAQRGNSDGKTTSRELFNCAAPPTVEVSIHDEASTRGMRPNTRRFHPVYAEKTGPGMGLWAKFQSNDVAELASDLHLQYNLVPAGSALTDAEVFEGPPCAPATVNVAPPATVDIDWGEKCVGPDDLVGIEVSGNFRGIHKKEHIWTAQGVPIPTPTPYPKPPLGGVADYPDVSSGPGAGLVAGVAAAVAAGTVMLGGAAWYAGRRRVR